MSLRRKKALAGVAKHFNGGSPQTVTRSKKDESPGQYRQQITPAEENKAASEQQNLVQTIDKQRR
jgi:hypothetical protein